MFGFVNSHKNVFHYFKICLFNDTKGNIFMEKMKGFKSFYKNM